MISTAVLWVDFLPSAFGYHVDGFFVYFPTPHLVSTYVKIFTLDSSMPLSNLTSDELAEDLRQETNHTECGMARRQVFVRGAPLFRFDHLNFPELQTELP